MTKTFIIPRHFHAGYSWLGRAIRRRVSDGHYAEGIYILVLTSILVGLLMAFYLWWAILPPELMGGRGAIVYAGAQLGAMTTIFLCCVLGFKPALRIDWTADALSIEHGKDIFTVPVRSIYSVSPISALEFHRHYRKYRQTKAFYNSLSHPLLLLKTDEGAIVLGLPEPHNEALRRLVASDPGPVTTKSEIFAA